MAVEFCLSLVITQQEHPFIEVLGPRVICSPPQFTHPYSSSPTIVITMGSIGEQKDESSDCDTSQLVYDQDLRADAVETLLCLSPKSPSANTFAAKNVAKHKQLISGNAFYQAHHKEEHDFGRDSSSTTITAINSISGGSGPSGSDHSRPATLVHQSATIVTPRTITSAISKVGVTAGRTSPSSVMTASARPITPCQTPDEVMIPDIHLPSPTSVHPALRPKPSMTRRTTEDPAGHRSMRERVAATRQTTSHTSTAIRMRNTGYSARVSSMYSSTPSSTRQYEARSSDACSGDPQKSLSPEQSSRVPASRPNTSSTTQEASSLPHATRRSADEKKLPITPNKVMESKTLDKQSGHAGSIAPTVMPLKLVPSPHVAQMAEPTQRALLEERKEQPLIDRAQSRAERYSQKKDSDIITARSQSAFGYSNGEPKTPKKSSFLHRIKSSWRAIPSFAGTMTAETRNQSNPGAYSTAISDGAIIHAQPKAQAILVGRSPSKPVPRSPSKRNFFRWKADENSSHINFSRKIASPDPDSLSPIESSPETPADIFQQVRKDAPAPPAKDTPPHAKFAQQGPTMGLGLRGIEAESKIQAPNRVPRFGTYSRLELAPLITKPNEHQYHASVVPELMNWEDLKHLTSRLEGLDLHLLPLPRVNSNMMMSSEYLPSLYSAETGSNTAGITPTMPHTRRSTMNSETRSTLRDVLTASPQTNPLPEWTLNLISKRAFETSSNDQRLDARTVTEPFKKSITSISHPAPPTPEHDAVHPQTRDRQTNSLHESRAVSSATMTIAYPGLSSDPSMTKLEDSDTVPQLERSRRDDCGTPAVPERASSLSFEEIFTSAKTPDAKTVERDVFSDNPKIILSPEQVGRGALPLTNNKDLGIDGAFGLSSPTSHVLQKAILIPLLQHLPTLPMTTFVEPLKPKRPKRPSVGSDHSAALADASPISHKDMQHQAVEGTKGAFMPDDPQDCQKSALSDSVEKPDLGDAEHDSAFEDLLDLVSDRAEERREMLELAIAGNKANDQASPRRQEQRISDQNHDRSVKQPDLILHNAHTPISNPKHSPSAPEEPPLLTHHLSREPSSPALESSPDITKGHTSRGTFQKTRRTRIITTTHTGSPCQKNSSYGGGGGGLGAPRPTLEESLAQNRAYEERIADLVRRLEEAETKRGR